MDVINSNPLEDVYSLILAILKPEEAVRACDVIDDHHSHFDHGDILRLNAQTEDHFKVSLDSLRSIQQGRKQAIDVRFDDP